MQVASERLIGTGGDVPTDASARSEVVSLTPGQIFWREFKKDRLALASIVFIVLMILIALAAPLVSRYVVHHPPDHLYLDQLDQFNLPTGPSKAFWFGVDDSGRDLFVRVLYGARTSLVVAFFATGISLLIGVAVGLVAINTPVMAGIPTQTAHTHSSATAIAISAHFSGFVRRGTAAWAGYGGG